MGESGRDKYGGSSAVDSGTERGERNPPVDGPWGEAGRGRGNRAAGMDSTEPGNLGDEPGDGERSRSAGNGTPPDLRVAGSVGPVIPSNIPSADFVIRIDVGLGSGEIMGRNST